MEKYIDALKLGAKRKAEAKPAGLKKPKLKEPKKAKITAEEYLAKVKATKTMKAKKGKKGKQLTDAQKLQYEKQIAELRKSLREQQKAKEKIATQSETAKAVKKINEEKEKEKILKLKAILGTDATKAKEKKASIAPLTLLDTDLTFKKLTKDEQKLLKSKLKTAGDKEAQLLAVEKFIELPKSKKESFVLNLLPTPKGAIEEVDLLEELKARKGPGAGAEAVGAELFGKTKKQRDEEAKALALALGEEVRGAPVKESLFTPAPAKLRTQADIEEEKADEELAKLEAELLEAEAEVAKLKTNKSKKAREKKKELQEKQVLIEEEIEKVQEEVEDKKGKKGKKPRKTKKAQAQEAQATLMDELDAVLKRVNSSIDRYSQGNQDRENFLIKKWSEFTPQLEKNVRKNIEITNDDINNKTEDFLEEYDKIQYFELDVPQDVKAKLPKPAPQPEAFIPAEELQQGQQQLTTAEEEAVERAFDQAQKDVVLPDSALEAIDRVNTQNAKEGKAINVLKEKKKRPKSLKYVYDDPELQDAIKAVKANTKQKKHPIRKLSDREIIDYIKTNDIQVSRNNQDFYDKNAQRLSRTQLANLIKGKPPGLEDEDEAESDIKLPEQIIAEAPPEALAEAQAQAKIRADDRKKLNLSPVAPEPLIAIIPTQSETDKDIEQVAQATVEADPTIPPADKDATASATADGFASGLKKVKKMHGKIIHDKVVKVMASQAGIQKGLNKVKKMHGGAMHDRVKGMLMKKLPSFFFFKGGSIETDKNTYFLMPDMSVFVSSDLFKENQDIIKKYLPVKMYFNAVPDFKRYRIVVIALSSMQAKGFHTIYTIDADRYTYNDITQELEDLGGINQEEYGQEKTEQAKSNAITRNIEDEDVASSAYSRGYSSGYQKQEEEQQEEEDDSPLSGILTGLSMPVNLVKSFL